MLLVCTEIHVRTLEALGVAGVAQALIVGPREGAMPYMAEGFTSSLVWDGVEKSEDFGLE